MKRQFAALILVGALTAPLALQAEPNAHPRPSVDDVVARLTRKLNLTEDQQAKAKPIIAARRTKEDALREQMRSTAEQSNKDFMAILTPDQQKTFSEMIARRHRPNHGSNRGPNRGPDDERTDQNPAQ